MRIAIGPVTFPHLPAGGARNAPVAEEKQDALGSAPQIMAAFRAASGAERIEVVRKAVAPMAASDRRIEQIAQLHTVDATAFEAGLKAALEDGPNISARRCLLWLYLRLTRFAEAEAEHIALMQSSPIPNDIVRERFRLLATTSAPDRLATYKRYAHTISSTTTRLFHYVQLALDPSPGAPLPIEARYVIASARDQLAAAASAAGRGDQDPLTAEEGVLFRTVCERLLAAKDIALVGNGSRLAGAGRGQAIDAHDVVIRCNLPEIAGFEADVGQKTDLLVFNESLRPQLPVLRQRSPSYAGTLSLGLHPHALFNLQVPRPSGSEQQGEGCVTTMPPQGRSLLSSVTYSAATTGLITIAFVALLLDRPLRLFGFDFFADLDRPHYFGQQTGAFLGHELAFERWYAQTFLPRILPGRIAIV